MSALQYLLKVIAVTKLQKYFIARQKMELRAEAKLS